MNSEQGVAVLMADAKGPIDRESEILCHFYDATGGPSSWNDKHGWKSDRPMREWHGVETNLEGRVVNMVLPGNCLKGRIPDDLGELKFLKILNLRDNALEGTIPPQLGGLESLEILDLSSNSLVGNIPGRLGQLGAPRLVNTETSLTQGGMPIAHYQVLEIPPDSVEESEGQEVVDQPDTSNEGAHSNTFEAPDLYAQGGLGDDADDDHVHWNSEPLQASQDLRFVSFWWRDEGCGNRTGALFLSLVSPSGTTVRSAEGDLSEAPIKEHRRLMPDPAEYQWTKVVIVVYPEDPLRRLARPGDRYRLTYSVGGGGGHILQATGFTLHFGGTKWRDGPYSRVLWKLDLSSNQLEGDIPQELGDLTGLGLLRLANNKLNGTVPSALGHLEGLVEVNLTNNNLDVLPMDLTATWALATKDEERRVGLHGNPWARPPALTMSQGLMSAEGWWKDIIRFGEGTSNKLKIVLVGLAEAGKTTVVRHFTGQNPPDKRTIGVEVTDWTPRDDLPLSVSLWDFAGQADYYSSHQIFLTKGALFILVVDLFKLVSDATSRREGPADPCGAIFRWLDILHQRVPGAAVALVGTHTGQFLPPDLLDKYTTFCDGSGPDPLGRFMADQGDSGQDALSLFFPPVQRVREYSITYSSFDSAEHTVRKEFRGGGASPFVYSDEKLFTFLRRLFTVSSGSDEVDEVARRLDEFQHQLAHAEETFISLVRLYMREMTEEIDLFHATQSLAEKENRSRVEQDDDSAGVEKKGEPRVTDHLHRVSRARGGPPPFVIHEKVFRVNLVPESVGGLCKWIVDAAAEGDSSNETKFSFPAVRVIVPSAWVDATAAAEALGERKGTPYVMWGDAVDEFQRFYQERHGEPLEDAASVLQRAMQHREAEGAVILSLQAESSPAPDDVIHLDPRWLIELVRRVTDHNLVDKNKQNHIWQELEDYYNMRPPSLDGFKDLSFITQGRLDREYLRFLWLHRTLEDEGDYTGVKLDDGSFESMLDTMIKCLFIYRTKSECGDGRESFIVPARLPEYGNERVLEETIGLNEVVVQTIATFRRSHAPCGIIGRFLAYSASKVASSGDCWQHGAHLWWETGHQVLVCETLVEKGHRTFPAIAICVKGNSAEAILVREDVTDILLSLLRDDVHGYPGLCSPALEVSKTLNSNEFQRFIRVYLDVKFASITEILEKIHRDSCRMFRAAFPSHQNPTEYPRLVVLKPEEPVDDLVEDFASSPAEQNTKKGSMFLRETWDRWIQLCDSGRCSFRLVFLCQHDFTEIPCGPEGKGYLIGDRPFLRSLKPLIQGSLWLLKIAVGFVANVDLPLHDMLGALVNATAAGVLDAAENAPIPDYDQSVFNADAKHTEGQNPEFKELTGEAYEALCAFMREQEPKERARCSCLPLLSKRAPAPRGVDWREHMVQIEGCIGGWAWVRKENAMEYTRQNGS